MNPFDKHLTRFLIVSLCYFHLPKIFNFTRSVKT